jgi:vitamin B12 transporter
MKNILVYFFILLPVTVVHSYAQQDTLTLLDEVLLTDGRLYKNSRSQVVTVLQDSTLRESDPSLTNVLKFNSPIYFRENGYGMVSSASFRGTTATQTAVVWNGININSQLNGQTDFNTVNTSGYDNIAIRAGGGSVLYGSGAIGGSVHLNNQFKFNRKFENNLRLDYGSFDTRIARYSAAASSERTSVYLI